jgi:hypothetical protein
MDGDEANIAFSPSKPGIVSCMIANHAHACFVFPVSSTKQYLVVLRDYHAVSIVLFCGPEVLRL